MWPTCVSGDLTDARVDSDLEYRQHWYVPYCELFFLWRKSQKKIEIRRWWRSWMTSRLRSGSVVVSDLGYIVILSEMILELSYLNFAGLLLSLVSWCHVLKSGSAIWNWHFLFFLCMTWIIAHFWRFWSSDRCPLSDIFCMTHIVRIILTTMTRLS